jgi:hypothetical protein
MWYPSKTNALSIVIAACALGGCSDIYYDRREAISLGAGDAVATNIATQMVDPWPANVGNRNIAFNGQRMQAAQERYRQNRVIPPVGIGTSSAGYQKAPSDAPAPVIPSASAPAAAPVR